VGPDITLYRRAQLAGYRGVAGRGEDFQVAALQHHAAVAGARGHQRAARLGALGLGGKRRQREAQILQRGARGIHVRNEMSDVIDVERPRRGDLIMAGSGGSGAGHS
jgi:hypothetical protein